MPFRSQKEVRYTHAEIEAHLQDYFARGGRITILPRREIEYERELQHAVNVRREIVRREKARQSRLEIVLDN